ncbi:MAG: glycosyltransferase family 2 protein [Cyclobacteriaceae bacterium]|nr:glycosyltransferase family 2 protein [Cyclobacteriaceae bacterium]
MQLSVIIPTKDRGDVFDQTLRCAIESIDHLDAEIIVVNDSKSTQPDIPKNEKIRLINNSNSGVASARNAGAKISHGQLLLFLDDDIVISKNSVEHVLNLHQQIKNACFNVNWEYPLSVQESMRYTQFGRFMKSHGLTSFKGWYADPSWRDNALFPSKSVASFHLSILRSDFEKVKGYNEQFPHAGFEDYDFPLQLKQVGLSFYIDSRVTVFHNEADRMKLENWLNSQERRAATRSVAVSMGYTELKLHYGLTKRILLSIISKYSEFFLHVLRVFPNIKTIDPLYFKWIAAIQASKIFKGYTSH